jgi:hypothetical protein
MMLTALVSETCQLTSFGLTPFTIAGIEKVCVESSGMTAEYIGEKAILRPVGVEHVSLVVADLLEEQPTSAMNVDAHAREQTDRIEAGP